MTALVLSLGEAPLPKALLAQGFGWAGNQVWPALKDVPREQSTDDAPQVFLPMLAVLSAHHEIRYLRLFRS